MRGQQGWLTGDNKLRNVVLTLLLSSTATLSTTLGFAAQAFSIEDIPHILAAGEAGFDKEYKGRLYTARMTVNDVLDRSTFYAVGFNRDGKTRRFRQLAVLSVT